ncbi:MAG: hypothetical protein IJ463_03435 [Bacilli bacterium]|nr:hypothetical protein [Bacilli bacterium]
MPKGASKALEYYAQWRRLVDVINKAIITCQISNKNDLKHFLEVRKPIIGGNGNIQNVIDYRLSRYTCYLIVQNPNIYSR